MINVIGVTQNSLRRQIRFQDVHQLSASSRAFEIGEIRVKALIVLFLKIASKWVAAAVAGVTASAVNRTVA